MPIPEAKSYEQYSQPYDNIAGNRYVHSYHGLENQQATNQDEKPVGQDTQKPIHPGKYVFELTHFLNTAYIMKFFLFVLTTAT